jgi:hypothetical protein
MAIISCPSCGVQIDDTSRFCRSCGRPFDPSELTTRQLEPGIKYHSPTHAVNQSPTTPAYLSPVPLPAVPATNDLTPSSPNRMAIIVLAATVGLLLFLLVAVLLVKFNSGGTPVGPPAISIPTAPPPPLAPPPPPPPPALGEPVIAESLKYPGAEVVMDVKSGQGKGVLQLQTKDSTRKVVEWYTAKLKPTGNMKLPFGNTMLRSDDITVIINGNEDGTSILITRGGD